MELITRTELPAGQCEIKHSDTLMLFGSCFTENIGKRLTENKFRCDVNPFGVLYNPMSVLEALKQITGKKVYTPDDIMESRGLWFSLMHHSSFSSYSRDVCLDNINRRLEAASDFMSKADWLVLTFGTARVYRLGGNIVGNCHKLDGKLFSRSMTDVDEIVSSYTKAIRDIRLLNPGVRFLFTVSPVRHARDGMHGNQISKSVLLLAVDRICSSNDGCHYFPSYEIMMDELRDYRFYADDMLHPSDKAVDYIWEKFSETYFSGDTMNAVKACREVTRALAHRPFNPDSDDYRAFISQILLKIETLKEKFTYLDIGKEMELCRKLLKK